MRLQCFVPFATAQVQSTEADLEDSARAMELHLGATTIDGTVARELAHTLRNDFEPVSRS